MRIKRVQIQGFKTFAKKTDFVFDPGITAIVGPNGSGKSNVVDAVRWCLGEQSFSLLRSKKTSDIIFSGSDKRARLNLAEVALTLDNGDGELPIDFSEIEITRRAYRDGDNEYRLNGARVRLGDINDLLAQTGLGKRTYALIGQGLIDRVLNLSPEDRRALFEEAAGITGYRAKRETTLRRLDATAQNLTRVRDILAELSPRLSYLRRQAERAQERDQIADDLRHLLRIWYGFRWHETLGKLEQQRAEEKQMARTVAARQAALAALNRQIEQIRTQRTELRSSLGELHGRASTLHREAERVGRELAVTQERLRQIDERREETQRELVPLRVQQETLAERLATLTEAVAAAAAEQIEKQRNVDAAQAEVARWQASRRSAQQAVDEARRLLNEAVERRSRTGSRLEQLRERLDALRSEQQRQQASQETASAEAERLSQRADEQTRGLGQIEQQLGDAQREISQSETRLNALREQSEALNAKRREADRALDQGQTRLDLLRRLQREGAGYASGVRSVLQASELNNPNRELSGVLGTVASLVRVPPPLDKAIETALGGAFQNVVTERWADASQAIAWLQRSQRGRATFLPLDRLNVRAKIDAPRDDGILGNAAELVECDARVDDVVGLLLNGAWVAQDLAAARRALDKQRGQRPTVVTLAGEIVRPGGAVTGGSDSRRQDDSVLARERELRELPSRVAAALSVVEQIAERGRALSSETERVRVALDARREAVRELARQTQQQRHQTEAARREADRAQQALAFQAQRLAEMERETAELGERRAQIEGQQESLAAAQAEAKAALAQAEANAALSGGESLLAGLADLRAAASEAQAQLRSQRTLHESTQRNGQSVGDQIRDKAARVAALGEEAETLRGRVEQLAQAERRLANEIERLRAEIEPVEARVAALEAQQGGAEKQEREGQEGLRRDERAWSAAQLRLQRTEDGLAQLRHEIEQDLGLVALERLDDEAYQPPLPLEAVVEKLPVVEELPAEMAAEIKTLRGRLSRVTNVNPEAPKEYEEAAGRHDFLLEQSVDLEEAAANLRKVIRELDELMETELAKTFAAVSEHFVVYFQKLFNGGTAKLVLTEPEDLNNTGVEIVARPPGKRPQSLALLSGGERSLSACALIFAILHVSPTPFCVLDEVDAALDEANVDRFRFVVEELSAETQFILVTHNRRTLEGANAIYGITMGDDGVSQMISLRLEGERIVGRDGGEEVAAVVEM